MVYVLIVQVTHSLMVIKMNAFVKMMSYSLIPVTIVKLVLSMVNLKVMCVNVYLTSSLSPKNVFVKITKLLKMVNA